MYRRSMLFEAYGQGKGQEASKRNRDGEGEGADQHGLMLVAGRAMGNNRGTETE